MTTAAPVAAPTPASVAVPRWTIDASHSHAQFSVRHLMISNVRGEFTDVSGEVAYDAKRPEATSIAVSIGVASIHTREEKRDAHLRSADFFDVETHPKMTFTSKKVVRRGEGLDVVGDLTIRGTTREVLLAVDEITAESADPWGNRRVGAVAKTKIKRSDYGMTWNAALETGGFVVGDEVTISIDVELIKDK